MNIRKESMRAGSKLSHELRRFGAWWMRCLLATLPPRWRSFLGATEDCLLLSREGDELVVRWKSAQSEHELVRSPMAVVADDLERLLKSRVAGLSRWWLLPHGAGIRRRLLFPANASRHLRQVVGFEIDRVTPFPASSVQYDVRVLGLREEGQIEVELAVVPQRMFEKSMQEPAALAVSLAGVDMADTDGNPLGFNFLPSSDRRRAHDPMRYWNMLLLGVALLAAVAAAAQVLDDRRGAADVFEAELQGMAPKARLVAMQRDQLVDLVEGMGFLDGKRAAQPAVTEVWNEVTLRLPDGTWLEKLAIEGDRLQLAGYSDDASSLVARMEGSSLWRKPTLTGALQSDGSSGRNRFTLTAELANQNQADAEAVHGDSGAH